MKLLFGVGMLLVLCACESMPQVHTSMSYNGQAVHSMDPTDPRFYMDDDKDASGTGVPQVPHYAVDPFCASTCQSKGGGENYCSNACGF